MIRITSLNLVSGDRNVVVNDDIDLSSVRNGYTLDVDGLTLPIAIASGGYVEPVYDNTDPENPVLTTPGHGTLYLQTAPNISLATRNAVVIFTQEVIADLIEQANTLNNQITTVLDSIGSAANKTASESATAGSVPVRDSAGRLKAVAGNSGNDVLTIENAQTSTTDTTTNALLRQGAWGSGATSGVAFPGWTVAKRIGTYFTTSIESFTGSPPGLTGGATVVVGRENQFTIIPNTAGTDFNIYWGVSTTASSAPTIWSVPWHNNNTTVDASGFIKEASPIVKLFHNDAVFNNQCPDDALFEKVGTGHYLIKNTLGFATQGWWIETPTDTNKNVKFYTEWSQLEDNTIEIKTFEPVYTNGVVGGTVPVDITEGRWIDLRLEPEPVVELVVEPEEAV